LSPCFIIGAVLTPVGLAAQTRSRAEMVRAIDSMALAPIQRGQIAGMSVAVVKGRDTILIKGYGSSDLELEVPTPANAVYEIGSVTKQFTTAALLQLVEQGKLSLDDDITKHLPSYPSRGNAISIRRILDHTSGIRSYTEIAEARGAMKNPISKDSLTALFSGKGFDYAPGTNLVYNNSAYFLAGLIIEKVSGQSYADYVQGNIFDRLGVPAGP
jgi:CubicO group peptidase (beta-lactamase class C family)